MINFHSVGMRRRRAPPSNIPPSIQNPIGEGLIYSHQTPSFSSHSNYYFSCTRRAGRQWTAQLICPDSAVRSSWFHYFVYGFRLGLIPSGGSIGVSGGYSTNGGAASSRTQRRGILQVQFL